jgi:RNA polymerase sigma-70 factor (ECF subfamily)
VQVANDEIDRDLLTRLAAGDTSSFDLLIERHEPIVKRQARRLLAWRADVDDVVQEVFLALWRGHGRFRGECALSTWLLTITIRECRRKLRREMLRDKFIGRLRIVARGFEAACDMPLAEPDENRRVASAVSALPAKLREVVVLHYLEGFSIEDAAKALGLKRSVVDVRLTRARQKLAEALRDGDFPRGRS